MDNASRLFSLPLRGALLELSEDKRRDLATKLQPYLHRLWDEMGGFQPAADEEEYVEVDPPREYHLVVAGDLTAANVVMALESIPFRWRLDLAVALTLYLEVDLEYPDEVL